MLTRRSPSSYFNDVAGKYDEAVSRYAWNSCSSLAAHLSRLYKGENSPLVLDYGTGTGLLAAEIRKNFNAASVVGLDISIGMLRELTAKNQSVPCVLYDGRKVPFREETFDVVAASGVLEFIHPPHVALANVISACKQKGVIGTTHLSRITYASAAGLFKTWREKLLRVPFWQYSSKEIAGIFEDFGCEILYQGEERGLTYPDGTVYHYSTIVSKRTKVQREIL